MLNDTRSHTSEMELLREIDLLKLELKQVSAANAQHIHNLLRERNLLRTLIDNLPDYVYFKDGESRFLDANKATLRIMKQGSVDDIAGKTDFDFYPPEFAKKYYEDEREIIETGRPKLNMEEEVVNEKGELRILSTSKVPLKDGTGHVVGLIGIGRDITECKHAEEVRLEKEKRLAEIGGLAAAVAHELRNPLAVIQAALYNLKKNPAVAGSPQLVNIEKKLWESGMIIENLLSYARIKPPTFETVDLAAALDECVGFFQVRFKDHEISVEKEYDPNLKLIQADPFQLKEVFTNILNNAAQAFPDKKGKIRITVTAQGDMTAITFADTGVGICEQDIGKIFTPFFSLKPKGTGLGLAICRELIQLHQGRIEAHSRKGEGSTFIVSLPRLR